MDETHKKQIKYNFAPENKEISRESDFGYQFFFYEFLMALVKWGCHKNIVIFWYACDWLHQIHIYENFESSYINRYICMFFALFMHPFID